MMTDESEGFFNNWTPRFLSILRIITAFMFFAHGTQKLFNAPASPTGAASPMSPMGFGGVLELVGAAFLFVGLFTRPVAFVLCGEMAVAYFMVHAPGGFLPLINKGELAVLYCFVFLLFSVAGGGEWSLDQLCNKRAHRGQYRVHRLKPTLFNESGRVS
jgi:putative oxidoreductase